MAFSWSYVLQNHRIRIVRQIYAILDMQLAARTDHAETEYFMKIILTCTAINRNCKTTETGPLKLQ